MRGAALLLRLLLALVLAPVVAVLTAVPAAVLATTDLLFRFRKQRSLPADTQPSASAASVVIPNWNGRELLQTYLPSVIEAMAGNPGNEVLVVDNGSTDGSAAMLRERFPEVTVLALETNLGFGGGSNAGFRAAKNDIVVLLNSDMRVDRDFLAPLLAAFRDPLVFAVSCQIFFSDPAKPREETGLTQGWWQEGNLRVRHRLDPAVTSTFPCFYGGGGSSAFDRRKVLELGGFDELLAPFYLEDTDLGYLAWKRGWKVLYEPRSIVFHEHRGTIGRAFSPAYIQAVLKKNFLLFCWKNIHEWRRLLSHFAYTMGGVLLSTAFGDSPERTNLRGLLRALSQLPAAARSRLRARELACVSDTEAFRRPLGGYFRDRFDDLPEQPGELNVLFMSPYPICPPVHGGGVFMYQTARELAQLCRLHLLILLDHERERAPHAELERLAASCEFLVRLTGKKKQFGSILPNAVREFASADIEWVLHRQIYLQQVDAVQLEYTALAQYGPRFRRIACLLFEHDVYFQSIGRALPRIGSAWKRTTAAFEYLRALRYELGALDRFDRIQVCSRENREYLASFAPELSGRIDDGLRAGIETKRYEFVADGREPGTMLFLGSFRHTPNQEALEWFIRRVLPRVVEQLPEARLVVIGSDPPPRHSLPALPGSLELLGFVEDVREPLSRYSVFVCPILSGSGVRVKLLEAFAAGIPVISTRIGAEGLADEDGVLCALADDPDEFAGRVVDLLRNPDRARALALRARREVEEKRDMETITRKLAGSYRAVIREKRRGASLSDPA